MQFNSPMYMSGTLALTRALIDFIKAPVRPVSGYNSYEYQVSEESLMSATPKLQACFVACPCRLLSRTEK